MLVAGITTVLAIAFLAAFIASLLMKTTTDISSKYRHNKSGEMAFTQVDDNITRGSLDRKVFFRLPVIPK